ncbi:hypothetical protein Droror1_Dr00002966 [Drosera rotundifolia]
MSSYPIFVIIWATTALAFTLHTTVTVTVPSIPACTNCTICQYPCRSQPPAPAAATATNPYSPPPISNISVGGLGGNCPPGTVACCQQQQQQQPREPLAGYSPPVMIPYSYVPYNNYSGGSDLDLGRNGLRLMKLFWVWWAVWGA